MLKDRRSYRLEIGPILIESIATDRLPGPDSLQVVFSIARDETPTPNSAEFAISNLSPEHRKILGEEEHTVRFSAGHQSDLDILFFGVVRRAMSIDGPTTVTKVQAGDADSKLITSKVSKSFAKGALISDVVKTLAKSIGADNGNLEQWLPTAKTKAGMTLPHAIALHGDAATNMTALCNSMGWSWCVQNGALQVSPLGIATSVGPLITPQTGLIGSPQLEPKGIVTFQCMLMSGVVPKSSVKLRSKYFDTPVLLQQTRHYGDSHGNDWQIDCKGKIG